MNVSKNWNSWLNIHPNVWNGLLIALVLLLATTLRFYDLGGESYSYDEGIMIDLTEDVDEVIANVKKGRPPVIVVLGYGWVQMFGSSETAARSLSALSGILAIAVLYAVGRALFGHREGLLAATVMSLSVFHVFYSQDYRYYGLLALMSVLSFFFYIKTLKTGRIPYLFAYVLTGALVFYTHYYGAFILIAQGIYFLLRWYKYPMRTRVLWFASQIAIIALLSPSLYKIGTDYMRGVTTGEFTGSVGVMGSNGPLQQKPPLWTPLHTLLVGYLFITINNVLNWGYLIGSALFLCGGTFIYAAVRGTGAWFDEIRHFGERFAIYRDKTNELFLVGCWLFIPVFLPFLISITVSPIYMARYTIGALPALCLVIALLLVLIRPIVPTLVALVSLAILLTPGLRHYYVAEYKDQWVETAAYVQTQEQADDGIAFLSVNNEPATRIQSIFNRYYAGGAAQCVIDYGLMSVESAQQELLASLDDCVSDRDHLWLIVRDSQRQALTQLESTLFDNAESPWHIVDKQEQVGVVIYLIDRS